MFFLTLKEVEISKTTIMHMADNDIPTYSVMKTAYGSTIVDCHHMT